MLVRRFFAAAAVLFALAPIFACASETEDDHAATPTDDGEDELKSLALTDADNGKTVTITEGQNLVVNLRANATTGYSWKVVSTDKSFGYPTEKYLANGGAVGSGGLDRFTWKTKSPLSLVGSHTVKMEYKRAWETNVAPAQTFSFTVNVKAGSCPQLAPPAPGFCPGGHVVPKNDANGCTTGYDCQPGCGTCGAGTACQMCWGHMACIPKGAMC